jgi:hypothetical protein
MTGRTGRKGRSVRMGAENGLCLHTSPTDIIQQKAGLPVFWLSLYRAEMVKNKGKTRICTKRAKPVFRRWYDSCLRSEVSRAGGSLENGRGGGVNRVSLGVLAVGSLDRGKSRAVWSASNCHAKPRKRHWYGKCICAFRLCF